jgi:hypothetical protein
MMEAQPWEREGVRGDDRLHARWAGTFGRLPAHNDANPPIPAGQAITRAVVQT